jgi:hypothetical protein
LLQYLADVSAVGEEGDDAHLPATQEAQMHTLVSTENPLSL